MVGVNCHVPSVSAQAAGSVKCCMCVEAGMEWVHITAAGSCALAMCVLHVLSPARKERGSCMQLLASSSTPTRCMQSFPSVVTPVSLCSTPWWTSKNLCVTGQEQQQSTSAAPPSPCMTYMAYVQVLDHARARTRTHVHALPAARQALTPRAYCRPSRPSKRDSRPTSATGTAHSCMQASSHRGGHFLFLQHNEHPNLNLNPTYEDHLLQTPNALAALRLAR